MQNAACVRTDIRRIFQKAKYDSNLHRPPMYKKILEVFKLIILANYVNILFNFHWLYLISIFINLIPYIAFLCTSANHGIAKKKTSKKLNYLKWLFWWWITLWVACRRHSSSITDGWATRRPLWCNRQTILSKKDSWWQKIILKALWMFRRSTWHSGHEG